MSELRGVWIANRPHSQVLESQSNIIKAMDFLQSHGFNLIFPVVWNRGYTLYPSQVMTKYQLPQIDPYYQQQQRDPLGEIITQAHQRQIKVIPWLEYGFAASHLSDGGHILKQYPHWRALNKDGMTVSSGGLTWMNGFNTQVQQFMLEIIIEILQNYQVEGIQGCDRFPALPITAGYDSDTIERYYTVYGNYPPQHPQAQPWLQWRADQLTDFLALIYQQVKAINPQAIVSLSPAVYPFCLNNLLQDSKTWVARGIVDLIHPQIYRSSFSAYQHEVKQIIKTFDNISLSKFAPGIALRANGQDLPIKDLLKCLQINRKNKFQGHIFFHYEGLRKNNDAVAIALKKNFSN
ncbi:hypothetical protein NIES4102_30510 [Chondrocystis sp. NIES-4102]|nr:hypothetical protein NIES4102_30510 [Chondrocystis sp. NIES-4102]